MAFLRHRGNPARVRCGFAGYLRPGIHADHWMCERWLADERRWARADAELDAAHRADLGVDFDVADLPEGAFLSAGEAWLLVRSGKADPAGFGHASARGEWFVRVNLARDLLALAGRETSDWDSWRDAPPASHRLDDGDRQWCDAAASVAAGADRDPGAVTAPGPDVSRGLRPFWR